MLNMYEVVKSVSCRFLPAQHAGQAYRARGKARRFLGEYALSAQDFSQVPLPHGPVLVNALSGQACHFTSRYNFTVFHFMCSYIIFLQISCKLSMSILEAVHKREPNKNDVSKTNIKKTEHVIASVWLARLNQPEAQTIDYDDGAMAASCIF